jgi:hypothetical protein
MTIDNEHNTEKVRFVAVCLVHFTINGAYFSPWFIIYSTKIYIFLVTFLVSFWPNLQAVTLNRSVCLIIYAFELWKMK